MTPGASRGAQKAVTLPLCKFTADQNASTDPNFLPLGPIELCSSYLPEDWSHHHLLAAQDVFVSEKPEVRR